ncbi:MAG: GntR family transcriptional regulator [Limnochordales bacterium]|nr:GntR family transcriptional regulator [Limnochordales bacterium]
MSLETEREPLVQDSSLSRGAMVYEMVREWIAAGQLRPGERLSEEDLARRAGVSRTPVREALKRLEAEGFVQVIPYRGVVVAEPSADEVADLCVVRDALEALAARLAAQSATDLELAALEEINDEFEAAVARGDMQAMVDANLAFHEAIWRASRNRFLTQQLRQLRDRILSRQSTTLTIADRRQAAVHEHRLILQALKDRDPDRAAAAACRHFQRAEAARLSGRSRE